MKKYLCMLIVAFILISMNAEISFNKLASSVQTFWSDENGLPSNNIMDIAQDRTGYIMDGIL